MRRKKEKDVEYENFIDVFLRNWRNVPGFKELIKLFFGFGFLFVLLIVMLGTRNEHRNDDKTTTTTNMTTTTTLNSYVDMIDYWTKSKFKLKGNINIDEEKYVLTYDYNGEIIGYLENSNGTNHFKIKDDIVYELKLNDEIINDSIFKDFNLNYIVPLKIAKVLKENKFIKDENKYLYVFNDVKIVVWTNNKTILKIEINDNNSNYLLECE